MSIKKFLVGSIIGSISAGLYLVIGQLSGLNEINKTQQSFTYEFLFLLFAPGGIFGVSTAVYFISSNLLQKKKRAIQWIVLCIASYILAAVSLQFGLGLSGGVIGFFIAGCVGAAAVVFSYQFSVQKISLLTGVSIVLWGGLATLLLSKGENLYVFYTGWQAGVFALLLSASKEKTT